MFSKNEEYDGGKVYLDDYYHLKVVVCGRVKIQFRDDRVKGIYGVLDIPRLECSLILVCNMSDLGMWIILSSGRCKMTRVYMVLAKGVWIDTLYKLDTCMVLWNSIHVNYKKRDLDSSSSTLDHFDKNIVAYTFNGSLF